MAAAGGWALWGGDWATLRRMLLAGGLVAWLALGLVPEGVVPRLLAISVCVGLAFAEFCDYVDGLGPDGNR